VTVVYGGSIPSLAGSAAGIVLMLKSPTPNTTVADTVTTPLLVVICKG
jgi:hypothetical protein